LSALGRAGEALARRLVVAALAAFPPGMRDRCADEAGDTVLARWRARRVKRGRWRAGWFLATECAGLVRAGLAARGDARREAVNGRRSNVLAELGQDVRYSLRTLGRAPAFSALVILVLALGIGANTAIFSVVNAALLRPLTAASPERLVTIRESNPEFGWTAESAAPANMLDWRERVRAFEDVAGYAGVGNLTLTGQGDPELVRDLDVTGNFFEVLGARAAHGRVLRDAESWDTEPRVVVLSDGFWTRRFGRDPTVLGRQLTLNGQDFQVVGIMPPGFAFPEEDIDLWRPMRWATADRTAVWFRRAHWLYTVARLAPGVTLAEAESQLQVVVRQLSEEYPATNRVMGAHVHPLQAFLVSDIRTPLLLLQGAVLLLLLVACANAGNLVLVRAVGRRRELAVRSALGARGGRVARLVLTESLLLSAVGGIVGVLLGLATVQTLSGLLPPTLPGVGGFGLDVRVAAFAVALTIVAGLAFGAMPALRAARTELSDVLREGGRGGSAGRATLRAANVLVVAEVAVALVLVLGAGLLIRSFVALRQVDPGFAIEDRITARITLPDARYDSAAVFAFQDRLLEAVRAAPGVVHAGMASAVPLAASAWTSSFVLEGWPPSRFGAEVNHVRVTPGWFEAMGVPVVRGRTVQESDTESAELAILINETLSRQYFAEEDPIGRRIAFDREPTPETRWWRIVGVVGDMHQQDMATAPRIEVYHPVKQDPTPSMAITVHGTVPSVDLIRIVRAAVAELDRDLALANVETLEAIYNRSLRQERFLLALLVGFGALALTLAALGVYGVASQAARRRTQEIGIRVALGARQSDVAGLILRQALGLTIAGVVLGTAGGFAATRVMESVLFGVAVRDPLTFLVVPVVLGAVALLATWLPARAAMRVDPLVALRAE
jgi:putative ABC transport system permease protein